MSGADRAGVGRSVARTLVAAAVVLIPLLLPEGALAQCAMCRAVVSQSPEGQRMAGELNKAILLMFFAPYLTFGSLAAVLFRSRLGVVAARLARLLLLMR